MNDPKPCVGCGYCCHTAPCGVSVRIYGNGIEKCPELIWKDNRYSCRLMGLPGKQGEHYREELYAGEGCCSGLNDWRQNVKNRGIEIEKESSIPEIPEVMQTLLRRMAGDPFLLTSDNVYLLCSGFKSDLVKEGWTKEASIEFVKNMKHIMYEHRCQVTENFMG